MRKPLITWSKHVELVVVTLVGEEFWISYSYAASQITYFRFSLSSVIVSMVKSPKSVESCFSVFKNISKDSNKSRKQVILTPPTPSNYNTDFPSTHNLLTKMIDNPPFKQIIETPQHNPPIDKSRHQSQNQPLLRNPNNERTTRTHYNLRQQPKTEYRIFKPPSEFWNQPFITFNSMKSGHKKPELGFHQKMKIHTLILDSSSDTSPSAPSKPSNTESVKILQPPNS